MAKGTGKPIVRPIAKLLGWDGSQHYGGGRASKGTVGIQDTAGSRGIAGTRECLGQAWGLGRCGTTGLTVGPGGSAVDAVGYQVMERCIICMAHRTEFWALEKEAQLGVLGVRQRCQRSQSHGARQRGSAGEDFSRLLPALLEREVWFT